MSKMIRFFLLGFFLSGISTLALANEGGTPTPSTACKWGAPSLLLDQDWFVEILPKIPQLLTPNEDRDYTMGLMFSMDTCMSDKNLFAFFGVQRAIPKLLWPEKTSLKNTRASFAIVAFTPDNLGERAVIANDRPYASLISLTNSVVIPINDKDEALESSFTVGILGTSLAQKFQSRFHRWYRESHDTLIPVDPLGWGNQISDGGEPTAMYSLLWLKRTAPQIDWIDMVVSAEATLGYYTTASAGFMAKFGRINKQTRVENFVRNGGVRYASTLENENNMRAEIYFLIGARAKLVGYNALLQGQIANSSLELPFSQVKHFVYDYSLGLGASLFNYHVQAACTKRSSEHNLPNKRSHSWCGLSFAYGF